MPTFKLATAGGPVEVEGRRFSHYINKVRFWFAVHDAHDRSNLVVVTHIASGMRVCQIPFLSLQAALGDRPMAARAALDALVARAGAEKVYATLSDAEKANKADCTCDDCGAKVSKIIGCPDGAEICQACFDAGAH